MKPLKTAVLACAVLTPLLAATTAEAATYPIKSSKLTANALYEAGDVPETSCKEPKVKRGDTKQARQYVDAVIACLESTWEPYLTDAGLNYGKVKVRHVTKVPKKWCDHETYKADSQIWYCDETRTMMIQIGKTWASDPKDLWLFYTTAESYGYHVQNLVGIADAYQDEPYDKKAELWEQSRRYNLQAACLSGVSMKSVWPLKGRTTKDWNYLVKIIQGDQRGDERTGGSTTNSRYWLKQGFSNGNAKACNTWTASSSKVA